MSVGSIIVAGLSNLLANTSIQLKDMETQIQKNNLLRTISDTMAKLGDCEQTLKQTGIDTEDIEQGKDVVFHKLLSDSNRTRLDITPNTGPNTQGQDIKRLADNYGLRGDMYFKIHCKSVDSAGNSDCDCTGESECTKDWQFDFISQRWLKGILVYNENFSLDFQIEYNHNDHTDESDDDKKFGCGVDVFLTSKTGGGGGMPCNTFDGQTDCGKTDEISDKFTTAFGYGTGGNGSGTQNTFIGYQAGLNTENKSSNTFVGYQTGADSTGGLNTLLGYQAGYGRKGGNSNIFIGYRAGHVPGRVNPSPGDSYNIAIGTDMQVADNAYAQFVVGYNRDVWMSGDMHHKTFKIGNTNGLDYAGNYRRFMVGGTSGLVYGGNVGGTDNTFKNSFSVKGRDGLYYDGTDLKVGGQKVCLRDGTNCDPYLRSLPDTIDILSGRIGRLENPSSSRTLKKNIKPFKDFDGSLQDILKTPLFTYEFKDDQPKKVHRGIISEELPLHLQIKEKGKVSRPAWPSIYGTLWAGIKALHDKLVKLETSFKNISKENSSLKEQIKQLQKEFEKNNKRLKELEQTNKRLKELEKLIRETQKESGTKVLKE